VLDKQFPLDVDECLKFEFVIVLNTRNNWILNTLLRVIKLLKVWLIGVFKNGH
jgi:hypothetical protein